MTFVKFRKFVHEMRWMMRFEEVARYPDLSNLKEDFKALVNFIDKGGDWNIKSDNESI